MNRIARSLVPGLVVGFLALGCGDKGGPPDAGPIDAPPPGGTITMAWRIIDGTDLDVLCADVGAVAVKVVATPIDAVQGAQFSFDCGDAQGTSMELDPATYDLRIELLAVGLKAIGDPLTKNDVVVKSAEDTGIGEVTFDVAQSGSAFFTIKVSGTTENCSTTDDADVTQFYLQLTDLFNTPIASTVFELDDPGDAGPAVQYNDNGTAPVELGADDCIPETWIVRIPSTASGPRRLRIETNKGADTNCYQGVFDFSIIGGDTELDFGTRVILPTATGACTLSPP